MASRGGQDRPVRPGQRLLDDMIFAWDTGHAVEAPGELRTGRTGFSVRPIVVYGVAWIQSR